MVWFNADGIVSTSAISTKMIKSTLLGQKFPQIGARLDKIYKRADWPPPGFSCESMFKNLWSIKNPTLRASRLKVAYKEIFSNERRFRFKLSDSPMCEACGQIETVEHQLFSCQNAQRFWNIFFRITGCRIDSLFDVINCTSDVGLEIIKSVVIRSLLQINRSRSKLERELTTECSYYIGIEISLKCKSLNKMQQWADKLRNF